MLPEHSIGPLEQADYIRRGLGAPLAGCLRAADNSSTGGPLRVEIYGQFCLIELGIKTLEPATQDWTD